MSNIIVEREKGLLELEQRIGELKAINQAQPVDFSLEIRGLEEKYAQLQREVFGNLSAWQRVNMARHPKRPLGADYLAKLTAFDELHGDRALRDDPALIGGFGKIGERRVMVLAQQKGRDTKDKVQRNFGMVSPEGYRKAERLMNLAATLHLPVVTFVDTSGADPGIASEEHGQSEAIASCLYTLSGLAVPTVATIVGEGGSGGALAIAMCDHVIMLEHSVYSVASPEGCAAILWGDSGKAEEAAARLKLTSGDLQDFGIIDEVIPEPVGGAHRDPDRTIAGVFEAVERALTRLSQSSPENLAEARYQKYRRIGAWQQAAGVISLR